jgi:hypothetical protein
MFRFGYKFQSCVTKICDVLWPRDGRRRIILQQRSKIFPAGKKNKVGVVCMKWFCELVLWLIDTGRWIVSIWYVQLERFKMKSENLNWNAHMSKFSCVQQLMLMYWVEWNVINIEGVGFASRTKQNCVCGKSQSQDCVRNITVWDA